jgi:hypothetical protein
VVEVVVALAEVHDSFVGLALLNSPGALYPLCVFGSCGSGSGGNGGLIAAIEDDNGRGELEFIV